MHWLWFIKYYSPLHVSSPQCSSSGGYSCIQAAYGTVTLCKSSWWPVDRQLALITNFLCTDYYLFVKHYSPLHVSSIKCSSSGGHSCIQAAYGTVTLCKSSWWPVDTQLALITNFLCTDYYLFVKHYSTLHVSSLKCPSSGGYSCTHAAYGTVTFYESS